MALVEKCELQTEDTITMQQREAFTWLKCPRRVVSITTTWKERWLNSKRLWEDGRSAGSWGLIHITCRSLFEGLSGGAAWLHPTDLWGLTVSPSDTKTPRNHR